MREFSTDLRNALKEKRLVIRYGAYLHLRDLADTTDEPIGFWNGIGRLTVDGRIYHGSGVLGSISAASLVSDLSIPGFSVSLAVVPKALDDMTIFEALEGVLWHQQRIECHIFLMNKTNGAVAHSWRIHDGFMDDVEYTRVPGTDGAVVINCETHSRILTHRRTETRSDADQRLRRATDTFFKDVTVQRDKKVTWGTRDKMKGKRSTSGR